MAKDSVLSKEEKAAMRELAKERKAARTKEESEKACLEKINEMAGNEKKMAKRIHDIVKETAPNLTAKTWYGMPAYTNEDGKVICFFQAAEKFGARYSTLGFQDAAKLDDGTMWSTSYALTDFTAADEKTFIKLLKKAIS